MLDPIQIQLGDGRDYAYYIRPFSELPALMEKGGLRPGRCLLVTDVHVGGLYSETVSNTLKEAGWEPMIVIVPAGEESKSAGVLQQIYDAALNWRIDRKTPLIALGGGVVGDLAGFAAATLLRGLPFVQLPTTLIAQVDSSIGGKTGINHETGKNLIGAFHQPALVCADPSTIQTLPDREWGSGLAEVVKHALIADADFFYLLEANWDAILDRDRDVVEPLIHRAAEIKAIVVSEDEREAGLRAILNFGHTFGHAIEQVAGYGHYTHGEAVALGMRAALLLSNRMTPSFDVGRADALVAKLPIDAPRHSMPVDRLVEATKSDKKALGDVVRFILVDRIGHAYIESAAPADAVRESFAAICS